jgi:hypothetical protein
MSVNEGRGSAHDSAHDTVRRLVDIRVHNPEAIAQAAAARRKPTSLLGPTGRLMVIAADHPARGALRAGPDALAMADRGTLLDRMCTALARPEVNGVLGTPDIIEDLLLLGALDDKVVIGSMNRGGLAGTVFEIDDRFTGYDAASIAAAGFEGGKMLLRIDPADRATAATLEACARAVSELASHRLMAMVEPFISHRVDARVRNDLSAEAVTRSITVSAGLGNTSAYTWLKLPVVSETDKMESVLAASTMPVLLLGGEVPDDPESTYAAWKRVLQLPTVKGLVLGRSMLYPADGDVNSHLSTAVSLL